MLIMSGLAILFRLLACLDRIVYARGVVEILACALILGFVGSITSFPNRIGRPIRCLLLEKAA
jgi:hypothetical protein